MKNKEELKKLKEEVENESRKPHELTKEDLEQVTGGLEPSILEPSVLEPSVLEPSVLEPSVLEPLVISPERPTLIE